MANVRPYGKDNKSGIGIMLDKEPKSDFPDSLVTSIALSTEQA